MTDRRNGAVLGDHEALDPAPSGTLQRGLAILECVGAGGRSTIGEVMEAVDLSRSAAYRILSVLRDHGFIDWDSTATGPITLGQTTVLLGMTALTQQDVWGVGRELMRRLADEVGESVLMAIVDDHEIVYVAHEDRSTHFLGVRRLLGVRRPLQVTSLGKAYAAALPEADLEALVPRLDFRQGTATTLTSPEAFCADVAATRRRGFAIDDGEQDDQVVCVGAAVLDHREMPTTALSIAGPRERIEPRLDELGARVRATAREISLRLGCPPTAYAIPTGTKPSTEGMS